MRSPISMSMVMNGANWTPLDISNVVEYLDIEDLVPLGNGHVVTENWVGRIAGTVAAPFLGNMGILRQGIFNGPNSTMDWALEQNNVAADIQSPTINNVFNGTNKKFFVAMGVKLKAPVTNNYWSIGALVSTQEFQIFRYLASTTVANQLSQRFNAVAATTDTATEPQCNAPQLLEVTCGAGGVDGAWSFIKDGIAEATFTRTNGGIVAERMLIGGAATGSAPGINSSQYVSYIIICDGPISSSDAAKLRLWHADRFGTHWKKGLTGGLWSGTSLVYISDGQSNQGMEGRSAAPYEQLTAPRAYALNYDTFLRDANDPVGANTNNSYSSQVHSGLGDSTPSFCNTFYNGGGYGPNDALIVTGNATGSTTASGWATNAGVSPPNVSALLGVDELRLVELMRNLPNPVIIGQDVYQGESDTGSLAAGDAWPGFWTTTCDAMNTFITSKGYNRWRATLDTIVVILPTTNWTSATPANWNNLRSKQLAFASGRPRCFAIQSPSIDWTDSTFIHLGPLGQAALGVLKANACLAHL